MPFDGPDAERVLVQHLTVAPEPPSARVANVPPALERLILELLAKHPAQRPASAALVEHELARMAPRAGRDAGDGGQVLCPFKGLAPFDSADAPYFCGRDRLVAQLVARLVGAPLLGVLGPSGSGKSSVLRAGLLPALASGALPGSEHWAGAVIRPGRRPLAELERALQSAAGQPLVVAVDQFEETFIACPDEDERRAFIDALVAAPRAGEPRCTSSSWRCGPTTTGAARSTPSLPGRSRPTTCSSAPCAATSCARRSRCPPGARACASTAS